jgi:hypothetical protein
MSSQPPCRQPSRRLAIAIGLASEFAPGGIFSAKVVGSFELIASLMLLASAAMSTQRAVQVVGAAMGLCVISGAIFFHLFTPLGVAVVNTDGSELFLLACGVWLCCALLLWLRREVWLGWVARMAGR